MSEQPPPPPSLTEDHALKLMSDDDLNVYSVGISTRGVAEVRMAQANPSRHIIATSIDQQGLRTAKQYIEEEHCDDQVTTMLEDVTKQLPYRDGTFDFIYARLVLHYLAKAELIRALFELYRITKPAGRIFAVVRSTDSHDAKRPNAITDRRTMLTKYTFTNPTTGLAQTFSRYFHSEDSIERYLQQAGFSINYAKTLTEHIYRDFSRTQLASRPDKIIEALATK